MCDKCGYQHYVDLIDEIQLDERYEFAENTLTGILSWVRENEHISDGQKKAVDNIYNSVK